LTDATPHYGVPGEEEFMAGPDDRPIGHDDDYDWDRR